jgi:hypothetical protein
MSATFVGSARTDIPAITGGFNGEEQRMPVKERA